jgi:hypothetical protein
MLALLLQSHVPTVPCTITVTCQLGKSDPQNSNFTRKQRSVHKNMDPAKIRYVRTSTTSLLEVRNITLQLCIEAVPQWAQQ